MVANVRRGRQQNTSSKARLANCIAIHDFRPKVPCLYDGFGKLSARCGGVISRKNTGARKMPEPMGPLPTSPHMQYTSIPHQLENCLLSEGYCQMRWKQRPYTIAPAYAAFSQTTVCQQPVESRQSPDTPRLRFKSAPTCISLKDAQSSNQSQARTARTVGENRWVLPLPTMHITTPRRALLTVFGKKNVEAESVSPADDVSYMCSWANRESRNVCRMQHSFHAYSGHITAPSTI